MLDDHTFTTLARYSDVHPNLECECEATLRRRVAFRPSWIYSNDLVDVALFVDKRFNARKNVAIAWKRTNHRVEHESVVRPQRLVSRVLAYEMTRQFVFIEYNRTTIRRPRAQRALDDVRPVVQRAMIAHARSHAAFVFTELLI